MEQTLFFAHCARLFDSVLIIWLISSKFTADLTAGMRALMANKLGSTPESALVRGPARLLLGDFDAPELAESSNPSKPLESDTANSSPQNYSSPEIERLNETTSTAWSGAHINDFVRSSGNNDDPFVNDSETTPVAITGRTNAPTCTFAC